MQRQFIAFAVLSLLSTDLVHAEKAATSTDKTFTPTKDTPLTDPDRFRAIGDNYVAYQWARDTGWVDHWEGDLQGHFSFGYSFKRTQHSDILFTYTGEFDFYLFDRASGPVVNRLSNPGLHYVHLPTFLDHDKTKRLPVIDIGLEHESDGQVQEVATAEQANLAQQNYNAGNRPFFDQISRGSNFVSLSMRVPQGAEWKLPPQMSLQATARVYLAQDYDVTWGPDGNRGKKLSDYNILRTRLGWDTGRFGTAELQWTVGKSGFKDDSFDVFWQFDTNTHINKLGMPIFLKYHHGPLNTISNYTQRQDSLGIGWRFSSFVEQDRKAFGFESE